MNIFKTQAVRDADTVARAIPVIDVAPAFRDAPGLEDVAARVREASERVGFFYLAGHGVPPAVIDAGFAASRELHALPLADKLALRLNQNNIGYLPVNESMQRASTVHKATRPNFNESFFISHDRDADHPDVLAGTPLRGRNQWPAGHEAMRVAMVRYFTTLTALGDRFLPTPHGVVNDSGRDRYSIAFFYSPNIDARIEVLPSCTSPTNPPRYPPAIYRDLVKAFYSANYFHQQDHAKTPAAL